MFGAIRRLFGGKPKDVETVPFSQISDWFDSKLKERSTLATQLSDVLDKLSGAHAVLGKYVNLLSLKQIDVEGEQKAVLEEHRDNFLSKMHSFLKQVSVPERDFKSIINYNETLSIAVPQFARSLDTYENLLKKFFSKEFEIVSENFAIIDAGHDTLQELVKQEFGVIFIYETKKMISEINKKKKLKQDLHAQLEREMVKRNDGQKHILKFETDLDEIRSSPEFEKYDALSSQKLKLEKELEREGEQFKAAFKPVSSVFIKYIGPEATLAKEYADNAVRTLEKDSELWLVQLVQRIAEQLTELEPNEEKRIKLRESLMKINEDFVKSFRSKYNSIKDALEHIHRQNRINTTTIKMDDIKYKLNHVKQMIAICDENVGKITEQLAETELEKDLLSLEKHLNTFIGVSIDRS